MSHPQLWVNGFAFGCARLCGGRAAPWRDPSALAALHRQLEELLAPDVLTLPLEDCFATWWTQAPEDLTSNAAGTRPGAAFKAMLASEPVRDALRAIIAAIADRRPVGLEMPAPSAWATRVATLTGEQPAQDGGRAGAYVANFLRALGDSDVSYLLVGDEQGVDSDELQPLMKVAEHYRWRVGVQGELGAAHFATTSLQASFWSDGELPDGPPPYHLRVPSDAAPELVLARLDTVRQGALQHEC